MLGGTNAIAQKVVNGLGLPAAQISRIGGTDRYDTAAQVAGTLHGEHVAGVATGLSFADALTGAAQLSEAGGPLVLTNIANLPSSSANAPHGIRAALGGAGLVEICGGRWRSPWARSTRSRGRVGGIAES